MDEQFRLKKFLQKYAETKATDSPDLESFLAPISERVNMLSNYGGATFINTLNWQEVYNYTTLIVDLARLALEVPDEHNESSTEGQAARAEPLSSPPPQVRGLEDPSVFPRASFNAIPLPEIQSGVESTLDLGQLLSHSDIVMSSLPFFHSTPQQPDAFPLPRMRIDERSEELLSIPQERIPVASSPSRRRSRRRTIEATPLPTIREYRPEQHILTSTVQAAPTTVKDLAMQSLQFSKERRELDQPLQTLPDLNPDHDFISEIRQLCDNRRNERSERRHRPRAKSIDVQMGPTISQPSVMSTAKAVTCCDPYFLTEVKTNTRIDDVLEKLNAGLDIPPNAVYRLYSSVQDVRAGESSSALPSINIPQELSHQSNDRDLIPIVPESIATIVERPALLPSQEPVLVPSFVEQLLDSGPRLSPIILRPRADPGAQRVTGVVSEQPRRKRRRRNRNIAAEIEDLTNQPQQGGNNVRNHIQSPIIPVQQELDPLSQVIQESTMPSAPQASTEIMNGINTYNEIENFKQKFKDWQQALVNKAQLSHWGHPNPLVEIRKIMDIYEGTSNLLMEILPHENVTMDRLIPQNLNKMAAAQRFTILLELNTRGMIALDSNTNCSVVGVENLSFTPTKNPSP